MSRDEMNEPEQDIPKTALLERKLILVATLGAMVGGFFPWTQPFGLGIWGFEDGDGLITMSTSVLIFLLVWLEWRKITAGAAVILGGFLILVAIVNLTSEPGPGVILATVTNLLTVLAGVSAIWKFGQIR
jgi:hypothetical protein